MNAVRDEHQLFQSIFIPTIAPNTQDVDIAAINQYSEEASSNMAGSVTPNIPRIQKDVNAKPSSLTILRRL